MTPNLGDVLDRSQSSDNTVLIETTREGAATAKSWTANALDDAVNAVARGLLRHGLKRGDACGVLSLNRSEFVAVYFGAMRAGVVVVPINWKLPAETIAFIGADSRVKVIFADAERMALVPDGMPAIGFDEPDWSSFLDPGSFARIAPRSDEIAQVLYTSGSTGRPKGVPLSHAGQYWAVEAISNDDVSAHRLLIAAPMFHMNALLNLTYTFYNNATAVLQPTFSPKAYVDAIEAHGVTWLTAVPTMLAMVAEEVGDRPPQAAFARVMRVYMGSSPFGQSLLERIRRLFPNAVISNAYGTTEAGPAVFGRHPAGLPTPDLSMGYPLPSVSLRIVDNDGHVVEGASNGILQIRTPALMEGYLNLPAQTARAIRDGWYHTNDIVRRDANGFYFFVGRADDMFVSGGENIYPGEVEKMIERHPAVQQAVVVPVPDEIKQQLPFAFVVRAASEGGAQVTESGIKQWTLQHGPAYQHPRWVEFINAMPLAGTNKINREALKQRARDLAAVKPR